MLWRATTGLMSFQAETIPGCPDLMKTPLRTLVPMLAVLLGGAAPAGAQMPEADPADVASVGAIITAVYDVISGEAGEARDWNRWHTLFAQGATLSAVVRAPDGSIRRVVMTPESYVERSAAVLEREQPPGGGPRQDDHYLGNQQRLFGEDWQTPTNIVAEAEHYGLIAHAFSTYESYRSRSDTAPFARGINSFQLMNDGSRWWVVSIYWQGESSEFPIPDEYIGTIGDHP